MSAQVKPVDRLDDRADAFAQSVFTLFPDAVAVNIQVVRPNDPRELVSTYLVLTPDTIADADAMVQLLCAALQAATPAAPAYHRPDQPCTLRKRPHN